MPWDSIKGKRLREPSLPFLVKVLPIMRIMPTEMWAYKSEQNIFFGRGCVYDFGERRSELVAVV